LDSFDTKLTPEKEKEYKLWALQHFPGTDGVDLNLDEALKQSSIRNRTR